MLKSETVGLAVTLELPLLVLDIQRAGPSTGMPTKPEQADLLMVLFGRNSESPVPVVAASTPARLLPRRDRGGADRDQVPHARLPALGRVPRERVRAVADPGRRRAAEIPAEFATEPNDGDGVPAVPARPRDARAAVGDPGTPGLEHRIGGLEKQDVTGNVSYDPDNHDLMVRLRAQKVAGIAADIPELEVDDPDGDAPLVLGWGSTYGPIGAAVRRVRRTGRKVATAHLHHLNPFPRNTGEVVRRYEKVLVPEMNLGQLLKLHPRRVPRRRGRLQPGPRPALQGGRARRRDQRPGGRR